MKSKKIKAIIFDLDGTLLNTLDDLTCAVNFALSKNGYKQRDISEIRTFIGNGIKLLVKRSLPNNISKSDFNICFNDFKYYYNLHMMDNTRVYDGIYDMLNILKRNNIKLAVSSNKIDSAVKNLCDYYFKGVFDVVVGEKDGISKKPDPTSVYEISNKLKIDMNNIVYVGDSMTDIMTAKNARIDCISVLWGYCDKTILLNENQYNTISNCKELLDIVF